MADMTEFQKNLVKNNLNLVHFVLQRKLGISVSHYDYEDYYQEGCLGLVKAASRFNPDLGYQFSTYAHQLIMGQIRYKRRSDHKVKLPRRLQDHLYKISRWTRLGYSLTEIAKEENIPLKDVQSIMDVLNIASLDAEFQDVGSKSGTPASLLDFLVDNTFDIEETLNEEQLYDAIEKVKDVVKEQYKKDLWEDYIYGAIFGDIPSQQSLADKYHKSQAQVSRTLGIMKQKLKTLLMS